MDIALWELESDYTKVLYEMLTIHEFVQDSIPKLYSLVQTTPLLALYDRLALTPSQIDSKYTEFAAQSKHPEHTAWYDRQSLKKTEKAIARGLKKREGMIQLVIAMESLRLSEKSKFIEVVEQLVDRLILSTMDDDIVADFIDPIIKVFYQESMPEMTRTIMKKVGNEETENKIQSPVAKKRRKQIIISGKVKKAPSALEMAKRRQSFTFERKEAVLPQPSKSGVKRAKVVEILKENIFIPETPTAKRHSSRHHTPVFVTPQKSPRKGANLDSPCPIGFGSPLFDE